MRLIISVLPVLLAAGSLPAQQGPRQPDVFLATLSRNSSEIRVGTPENITTRGGYDNQPSFGPDGRTVYYTSVREDAQADIYRYDIETRTTTRITKTAPESEYSAAVMTGGRDIAVIRVERDSTQRLWRFPLNGDAPEVLLPGVKPAGYFAFADEQTVALFVLGDPATLQIADRRTGAADTIVANVGRSLHRIPGQRRISYVSRAYQETAWIMSVDPATGAILPVAKLPTGTEDYVWLPDGRIVAGQGSKLLVCDPAATAEWREFADLASAGLTAISRLAVSSDGSRIAIVAVPAGS